MITDKISWEKTNIDGKECYVLHYSDLLTLSEYQNALITGEFDGTYSIALNRARVFGGKRDVYYSLSGGIIFETSVNRLHETEKRLKALFDGAN